MQESTEKIIVVTLGADSTIPPGTIEQVLDILKGNTVPTVPTGDRVITRAQVANIIGKSKTLVDLYGRKGIFKRVRFKDTGKDSIGYSYNSVQEAIRKGIENGVCGNASRVSK